MVILFCIIILCVGAILIWKHLGQNHDSRWSSPPPSARAQQPKTDYSELKERYKKYHAAASRWAGTQQEQQPNGPRLPASNWVPIGQYSRADGYLGGQADKPKVRRLEGIELRIHYVDRYGNYTERDIRMLRHMRSLGTGSDMVLAFCQLRGDIRQFAVGRVQQAIDLETGEIIHDLNAFLDAALPPTSSAAS